MHENGWFSGRRMEQAQFGVTFFTSSQRHDTCGSNGLPLTPNSIRILGRSRFLKSLSHPNLAEYIEVIRGKHERIILVAEYYGTNLGSLLKSHKISMRKEPERIFRLTWDILNGLSYLNQHGIICGNLSLENVIFDTNGTAKLFNYGMFHMTNGGSYVAFPIGHPKYNPPQIYFSPRKTPTEIFSSDIWALGIILTELALGKILWEDFKAAQIIGKVAQMSQSNCGAFEYLVQEYAEPELTQALDPELVSIIKLCLSCNIPERPTPSELLSRIEAREDHGKRSQNTFQCSMSGFPCKCEIPIGLQLSSPLSGKDLYQCSSLWLQLNDSTVEYPSKANLSSEHLFRRSMKEVFHLWQLAGGDVIGQLKRQGLTRKKPSILSLPRWMKLGGEMAVRRKDRGLLLDQTVILLPLDELVKRLSLMPYTTYYPLIVSQINGLRLDGTETTREAKSLPLVIRERDIEYQFNRMLLFHRLIKGYPYTRDMIHLEALADIPPFFRPQIWTCLLGIQRHVQSLYDRIDKETPTSTDRQIEVDIPRCHQYDELLSSLSGHQKFKRILKAWVVSNKEYVYWQGLDSLSAPFLYLHFNNEAMAFASLSAFIPKYLYNFFLKDNSAIIQEYLAKFSQLIAFHDPELTNHLDSIGFIPELYAIPWFLTMFSHVFPLHKIFHLWDKLLLGDSSFPLCIGLSILFQLRDGLLSSGFNECILLFSDMPEINIEKCVSDSVEAYSNTPRSVLCRKHEPPPSSESKPNVLKNLGSGLGSSKLAHGYQGNDAWKMEPIDLVDLKKEKCPRISGEDLITLMSWNDPKTSSVVVIDVRNKEDYNRGAIPGSISVPCANAFTADGKLCVSDEVSFLQEKRGALLVVVGNRGDGATKFAEKLLRLQYPKLCVLHRGIDIFRSGNILIVP